MYWFGEKKSQDFKWHISAAWDLLPEKKLAFSQIPITQILDLLDGFSRESFSDALPELMRESGFSFAETEKTLKLLPELLKRSSLEKRLNAEFTKMEVLDKFTKLPHGTFKTKSVPHGILLHVTAGNVFLSSIDSLIMGFLTKNISIIKVSSNNKFFPLWFAEKLKAFDQKNLLSDKFAVLHWKGGNEEVETFIKSKVNAIIAWGGEEMLSSYRKDLPSHVKLLDFGPKISLQVMTKKGLEKKNLKEVANKVIQDIVPWNQAACASPQNLYLQEGISEEEVLEAIHDAFNAAPERGKLSDDEATEILKENYRGLYSELMEEGRMLSGTEHLLHLERNRILRPSPLNRTLIIKRFRDADELFKLLEPFSYYLQSCSYLFGAEEKEEYLNKLSLSGLKRFAPLGTITFGSEGAPHDGRFVLRELVSFVGDEIRATGLEEVNAKTNDASSLKTHFENSPHPAGYIFSSGGTTGEPKYVHFSYEEFDYMTDMLVENFRHQGIKPGMTIANLFVAGNLWSSFLGVEKALEKLGTIQLPIGGMCSHENILQYLRKFKPDAVLGIPSMLVMNAEYMQSQKVDIEIPMIFYAGEALSESRKEYLKNVWKTKFFGSAAYASVDAGVVGYQCEDCGPGEHHLFSDLVEMKIINDEAVVTSYARNTMPVVNYRTGDKAEWISDCKCGRPDKRFKLLGRIDNVIHIWSCRLLTHDVESSLNEQGVRTYQIKVSEVRDDNVCQEKLIISYESQGTKLDSETLLLNLYERSRDVKDTINFELFKKQIELVSLGFGQIPRNPRTGKISLLIDQRI